MVKVTDDKLLQSDISNIVGSRAIIKIEVEGLHVDYHPALTISLSDKGEEVAFGGSVDICSNLTILSRDNHFYTHQQHANRSKVRMTTHGLLCQFDQLFPKTEPVLEDLRLIERLKNIKEWNAFVGSLFNQVHYMNRKRLNKQISSLSKNVKELPITASLIADVVAEAVVPTHDVYRFLDGQSNVWNYINYGTEQMKTEHSIQPAQVLTSNAKWTDLRLVYGFGAN